MNRILRHVDRKDFKKTRQRQIDEQNKLDVQKLKEWQKAEAGRKQIARPYKSDWKKEINLQESDWTPVAGSIANSSSQTFQYGGEGGPTATFSGLGGVEAYPSTVDVDGETLNTPDYSQLPMQGYAKPLGMNVQRQTKQTENERIDAEILKLEEQIKQLQQKISDLGEEQIATEPQYTGMSYGDYIDKTNEVNDKWNEKTGPLGEIVYGGGSESEKKVSYAKLDVYERARAKELDALNTQYNKSNKAYAKAQNDHFAAYSANVNSVIAKQEALRVKIAELEKQRPINQQLDAAQQAYSNLPYMGARVQGVSPTPAYYPTDQSTVPGKVWIDNPMSASGGYWDYDSSRTGKEIAKVASTEPNIPPQPKDAFKAFKANVGTASKIMLDYLRKSWDNRVVADNEYLGRDYIDNQFFPNVIFDNDKTAVGGSDAVVGTGQPPRVDPKTGEIVVRASFDFNKNEYEALGDPEKQEFAQRLKRFGGMSDYALDAIVDGLPANLGTFVGMGISPFIAGSKSTGRGNNIPIVIRFTPQELKRKNREQYDQLVRMGLIKESTFDRIRKHR